MEKVIQEIRRLEDKMDAKFDAVESKMDVKINALEKTVDTKINTLYWVLGVVGAIITLAISVVITILSI